MVQVKEILHCLEQAAPYELAEHWDNVGLLVGDPEAKVEGVLCALDITETVVEEAAERGCNLIVAHHPVIFTSVSRVTADTVTGRILISMIRKGISGICMHTNMDCASAGVNDLLAASLGLTDVINMEAGEGGNLGRVGNLPKPMTLQEFAQHVKLSLGAFICYSCCETECSLCQYYWKVCDFQSFLWCELTEHFTQCKLSGW